MSNRQEILLTGAGGQGLILASIVLAEAAVNDNKNVVQTQSYGPEARGGASMAGVIIDVDTIEYPKVTKPSVLLCMNQASFNKYIPKVEPGCTIIVDSTFVSGPYREDYKINALPITQAAREQLGREVVANMLALGAINAATGLVDREIFRESIFKLAPKGSGELNQKAFDLGYRLYNEGMGQNLGISSQTPQ
ncbi:MAG: 2-oxoacid:acceptor oxidoreductase family protein [Dethiobacteria bacterium]|nr:2-oxoacid:acceptor oxidoreductase family protein [Bacillota bacterium]MDW7728466.1 2-oxoacid:acceptor oxidoreductase family protein [Bacillota bacterium]